MDEECLLESSALYQHLQQIDEQNLHVTELTVTRDTNESASSAYASTSQSKTVTTEGPSPNMSIFGVDKTRALLKYEICQILLKSSPLSSEHYSILKLYLDTFLPPEVTITQSNVAWLFTHGLAAAVCISQVSSRALKAAAAISWCSHLVFPSIVRVVCLALTHKLRHTKSIIYQHLDTFKQAVSVVGGVRKLCQELNLMSLSTTRMNLLPAECKDDVAETLKGHAIKYIKSSVIRINKDLKEMTPLLDCPLLCNLQLLHAPSTNHKLGDTFMNERNILLHLLSKWIFYLGLVLSGNISSEQTVSLITNLNGIETPHQLAAELQFYKTLVDDEVTQQKPVVPHLVCRQEQALYSLYLHCRQLLKLAKLAHEQTSCRTDQVFHEMSAHIGDCTACLALASINGHSTGNLKKVRLVQNADNDVETEINVTEPLPVIDELFVTEKVESADDAVSDADEQTWPPSPHHQYEVTMMRELKGVINELAKEREIREEQVAKPRGLSVEAIAKETQDLVNSRDIRALVESAALPEHSDADIELTNQTRLRAERKYQMPDDVAPVRPDISTEMRQLAEIVAERFVELQESEEVFGSDEENDGNQTN